MNLLKKIKSYIISYSQLLKKIEYLQEAIGRIEQRQLGLNVNSRNIEGYEFKVYSQSGEDGIIQYLINKVDIKEKTFVEFGVENYLESNTRFLALNNYWSGLVIDGSPDNIRFIKNDPISWRREIVAYHSFITKDNINDLIIRNGFAGDLGLLSIDIDGNDYWVWQQLDVVNPYIVICEYNSFFGAKANVTVPYNESFVRSNAHHSMIYYGASITALYNLAVQKGYSLVGSNMAGNNVFFVRNDALNGLKPLTPKDVYRETSFREAHNESGNLLFTDFNSAQKHLFELDIYDLNKSKIVKVKDVL